MSTARCNNCNNVIPTRAKFCPQCGKETPAKNVLECENCHSELPEASMFCPYCGKEVTKRSPDDAWLKLVAPEKRQQILGDNEVAASKKSSAGLIVGIVVFLAATCLTWYLVTNIHYCDSHQGPFFGQDFGHDGWTLCENCARGSLDYYLRY